MLALALLLQSVLVVPSSSYPTPQSAVDAASPGDLVVLRGGTYRSGLRIDKSLTIHAEPRAVLERDQFQGQAVIEIQAPADAVVNLSNLDIGMGVLDWFDPGYRVRPAIATLGVSSIEKLRLYETAAQAPRFIDASGVTPGAAGVKVRAGLVEVIDSFVRASDSTHSDGGYWFVRGEPGILNETGDVLMNGGLVQGAIRDATTRNNYLPPDFSPETAPGIQASGRVLWLQGVVESGRPGLIYDNDLGGYIEPGLVSGPRVVAGAVHIGREFSGL